MDEGAEERGSSPLLALPVRVAGGVSPMSLCPPPTALSATTFCRVSSVDTLLRGVGSGCRILIELSLPCVVENSLPLLLMSLVPTDC